MGFIKRMTELKNDLKKLLKYYYVKYYNKYKIWKSTKR